MTWRVEDGKKDTGRETKEWKMKRAEKAFDVAKRIKSAERKKQRREGKEPKKGPSGIADLADYLYTVKSKLLDKLIEDVMRKAQEAAASKARTTTKRAGTFGAGKLKSLASGFKNYMERKTRAPLKNQRKLAQRNQTSPHQRHLSKM